MLKLTRLGLVLSVTVGMGTLALGQEPGKKTKKEAKQTVPSVHLAGHVDSVDWKEKRIVVKADKTGEKIVFGVAMDADIAKGSKDLKLWDVKSGQFVKLKYKVVGDKKITDYIVIKANDKPKSWKKAMAETLPSTKVQGILKSVDRKNEQLVLDNNGEALTLKVNRWVAVRKGEKHLNLWDLKPGKLVEVKYRDVNGSKIVNRILVKVAEPKKESKGKQPIEQVKK